MDHTSGDHTVQSHHGSRRWVVYSEIPRPVSHPAVGAEYWDRRASYPVFDLARSPKQRKTSEQRPGSRLSLATSWLHLLRDDDCVARLQLDILVRIITLEDLSIIEGKLRMLPVHQPHDVDFFHIGKRCESACA